MMLSSKFPLIFVCLYLKIVQISCEDGGISLAFVIDETRSMGIVMDDIKVEVKNLLDAVLRRSYIEKSNFIEDLILVTINDPDVAPRTITRSKSEFLNHLFNIKIGNLEGNNDCPEMSMAGIYEALMQSRPGSYVFVFTDATAKDHREVDAVVNLCRKKQIQVIFILTGDCGKPNSREYMVYHEVAEASLGQVYRLKIEQLHEVINVIKDLLKRFQWKVIAHKDIKLSNGDYQKIMFTIDEVVDNVIVSVSGKQVQLYIMPIATLQNTEIGSRHLKAIRENRIWSSDIKVVKLNHLKPGNYTAWVKGSGSVSVVIYAGSESIVETSFSTDKPKSQQLDNMVAPEIFSSHTALIRNTLRVICRVKGVPKPDIYWQLKPQGSNEFHNVTGSGEELTIRKLSPNDTGIYRCVAKNSKGVATRDLDFIDAIIETKPKVNITKGLEVLVDYDGEAFLSCEVNAYPEPDIYWFKSDGKSLPSKISESKTSEYVSHLNLTHVKNNDTYSCKATNNKGSGKADVQVKVRSVFRTITSPAAKTSVKYGDEVKIRCNIESNFLMNISWFVAEKEISNNDVYSISADRTELVIKYINYHAQGNYLCLAYLVSDPNNRLIYSTNVKILGLARPIIESTNTTLVLKNHDKFELRCKITEGYPQPSVQWYKKEGDNFELFKGVNKEVLSVASADLSFTGQYKCVAKNVLGVASAIYDVTVRNLPEVGIIETHRNYTYGSTVVFTCITRSYVQPTIEWTDAKGAILENTVTQKSNFDYISQLKIDSVKKSAVLTCTGRNDMGVSKLGVDMKVSSPFTVKQYPNNITSLGYGAKHTIRCDIRSSYPMTIRWYRQNSDGKPIRDIVYPSDKLSISSDGTELTINSMDLDLKGNYTCEASLDSDAEEKVSFQTYIDTSIINSAGAEIFHTEIIMRNKKMTAICRVKGDPKPIITWKFKPDGSEEFQTILGQQEMLNIPNLLLNRSGVYKCVAKNILGEDDHDFSIFVEEEPKILNEETTFPALKFDRVLKVPCNVSGIPYPVIKWKKEGKIINNSSKYDIKTNVLYIKNITEKDSANYTCEAKNDLGTTEKTFKTIIRDSFKNDIDTFYGDTHFIYAIQKESMIIRCTLSNADTESNQSTRWYLNGQYTNYTGTSYSIETVTESNNGVYTCRVDTDEGSTSESYDLQVGYPPSFVFESRSTSINWSGEDIVLDCTVDSLPVAKIQWLHNGRALQLSSNYSQEYEVKDWGEYTCILTNVLGSVERTFNVVSTDCYINEHMITQNMPLWFNEDKIAWPMSSGSGGISLGAHKNIVLACTANGKTKNTFQVFPNKNNITAECYKEDKFIVDGKTYKFSELQCKTKVEPLIVNTHEECSGSHTEMVKVGFILDRFLEAYEVCYDKRKKVPVFGSTPITISDFVRNKQSLFDWNPTPTVGDEKPFRGYTCENNSDCCYQKSQLINVETMVFGPVQAATLKDNLNSVAVWIPCNRVSTMSWLTFDKVFALKSSEKSWISWTGASDYRNKNGGLVPRYLWKVVNYKCDYTVVVYVNDPEYLKDDFRCHASCDTLDIWELSSDHENAELFYCCTLNEFEKAFGITSFN